VGADETLNPEEGAKGQEPEKGARGQGPGAGDERLVVATVVAERPSSVFEIVLDTRQTVRAHLVGEGQRNFVRLVPGDRVEVELMPHDPTRGRIQRKL
jgi:translation initiation factor IF-1